MVTARGLRLSTGLVLFGYIAQHLVNHALGLVSVALAERGLVWALAVWHSVPGTLLLYGVAGVHVALAFDAIYSRRTLRAAPLDLLRILLGLGIPTLLIGPIATTRLSWELYGQSSQYSRVVWSLWTTNGQGRQLALLVPGWAHGCLGLHLAFSARPAYRRWRRVLWAAALLLPVLGALGFFAMGKELEGDRANRATLDAGLALHAGAGASLARTRDALLAVYAAACVGVFAARGGRTVGERRARSVE